MPGRETRAQALLVAGRYQLRRELGSGGMGVVWLADDQLVHRQVAVKELRPPPGLSSARRDVYAARALREARSVARVRHPNAVILYDVLPATTEDDAVYLVMEYIVGPTLAELIERDGVLPDATVASLGIQLLDVLEAAHDLGIVHRDIKPANVMIAAGNHVKLTDFGIAHTLDSTRYTLSGTMGTMAYMAPELFSDQPIHPAADLWSLGATLYYAVEGEGPFDRETAAATLGAIVVDDIPVPHCSPGLSDAISGMLRRDPSQRTTIAQARSQLLAVAASAPGRDTPPQHSPRRPGHPPGDSEPNGPSGMPEEDPKVAPPPQPADPVTFTNMPGYVPLALLRAACLIAIIGGAVAVIAAMGHAGFGTALLVIALYLLGLLFVCSLVSVKLSRRKMLILDSSGLAVDRVTLGRTHYRAAQARWDQVVRIGPLGRPPRGLMCAWISASESKPAMVMALCPLDSPHFPLDEIRAVILSYCPTVTIEPMQANS